MNNYSLKLSELSDQIEIHEDMLSQQINKIRFVYPTLVLFQLQQIVELVLFNAASALAPEDYQRALGCYVVGLALSVFAYLLIRFYGN